MLSSSYFVEAEILTKDFLKNAFLLSQKADRRTENAREIMPQKAKNNGRFCNNSEIDRLISKRLSVENKEKLS